MIPTKVIALSALLWVTTTAHLFPFRIKLREWEDNDIGCDTDTAMTDFMGQPYQVYDGDCHTARRPFKLFTFSKNGSPFSKNMKKFGICDLQLWQEPDCQGDLVDEVEQINDREMDDKGCWGMKEEGAEHGTTGGHAWSLSVKCRKE